MVDPPRGGWEGAGHCCKPGSLLLLLLSGLQVLRFVSGIAVYKQKGRARRTPAILVHQVLTLRGAAGQYVGSHAYSYKYARTHLLWGHRLVRCHQHCEVAPSHHKRKGFTYGVCDTQLVVQQPELREGGVYAIVVRQQNKPWFGFQTTVGFNFSRSPPPPILPSVS